MNCPPSRTASISQRWPAGPAAAWSRGLVRASVGMEAPFLVPVGRRYIPGAGARFIASGPETMNPRRAAGRYGQWRGRPWRHREAAPVTAGCRWMPDHAIRQGQAGLFQGGEVTVSISED